MSPAAIGAPTGRAPLPVTLVAGWVGSGKSTLVGRVVDRGEEAIAVVHAGAPPPGADRAWWCIPVEEELVYCSIDRCPCCAVRLDLVTVIGDLARRRARPDRVVVGPRRHRGGRPHRHDPPGAGGRGGRRPAGLDPPRR